jgi:hypothetical protein
MERGSIEMAECATDKRAQDVAGEVMVRHKKLRCGVPLVFALSPHRCHHTSDHTLFFLTTYSHCLPVAYNIEPNTTTQST